MSLRNSFSNAATSWTLCSSSKWTSHPRSNSLRSWKRFSYISNPHQRRALLYDIVVPGWTHTCRTRFLELPTRKIPTVCSPKSQRRFSLSTSTPCVLAISGLFTKSPAEICSASVAQTCTDSFPTITYRVVRGAGSRAPRRVEPVCK